MTASSAWFPATCGWRCARVGRHGGGDVLRAVRRAVPVRRRAEPNILARIAAGVIWVAALLASLLSLERLFQNDYEDGSLDF